MTSPILSSGGKATGDGPLTRHYCDMKTCVTGEQHANATMGQIRGSVGGLQGAPILYGGSVKANNMASYARMPNINGALVGGASLAADSFAAIVHAATAEH